ncbi:MAG: HAD-IA family hydrolase [Cyanobacteria bacterium M_surface_7_m2_040]|nr:HAD-IA family hydrolase [Cyanobacteria bacterium K_Offshore_0m_m2_072]MBM5828360.1 HAD-IA family hydrolase [Cyanobacteria bacterium M_surface_7_m2_040]
MVLKALLWDVDGTLAETERDGHRPAFNRAFAEAGLPLHWSSESYGSWLTISGGQERIASQLRQLHGREPDPEQLRALQSAKQHHYRQLVQQGAVQLRPGVKHLLLEAHQAGLTQVIVTTSGRPAVAALLDQLLGPLQHVFAFWVCGEDVARKKPDPEAYRLASQQLLERGLVSSDAELLVIEDSRNGLAAARAAALRCLVSLSHYGRAEVLSDPQGAAAVVSQLGSGATVVLGPPCQTPELTLSYLQALVV